MSEPSHKKYDLDSTRRFIEAIRSINGNPTMDKQQCEEWIEEVNRLNSSLVQNTGLVSRLLIPWNGPDK